MKIMLNGCDRDVESGSTLADLVAAAGLAGRRVAIELNQEIVPRGDYPSRVLATGDRIEVVHAIGGG
jgi:sulfur carrier protein